MKESYFIFNGKFYKQVDGVAMGSPIGPTLTNDFLAHFDIFALFTSPQHLEAFRNFLNG